MNTQRIQLDISKRPCIAPVVRLRQGDRNGTILAVDVTDNGEAADLSGLDATLLATLPDGSMYQAAGTVSGSTATFQIDETDMPSGTAKLAYVELSDDGATYSTQGFTLTIEEGCE